MDVEVLVRPIARQDGASFAVAIVHGNLKYYGKLLGRVVDRNDQLQFTLLADESAEPLSVENGAVVAIVESATRRVLEGDWEPYETYDVDSGA
jgi:hypothetical protein